jgi:hypothetical protein
MVHIWLTVINISLNHLSIMDNTDVTNSHRTWKDVTVRFSAFPSLIQIHGHKTCIQGLFEIMQIHLQVIGYQFIEMVKHLPLLSGPGWSLKRRQVGVHTKTVCNQKSHKSCIYVSKVLPLAYYWHHRNHPCWWKGRHVHLNACELSPFPLRLSLYLFLASESCWSFCIWSLQFLFVPRYLSLTKHPSRPALT